MYQSTFGSPATVQDYTELVEHGKPLPGSVRTTFNGARKDEAARKDETTGKKTGAPNNSRRIPSHVMGTFGTNRIYTVGRVVKVEDLMR